MTPVNVPQSSSEERQEPAHLVLVALDGSSMAEEGLPVAGTIAHHRGSKVHLATVLQPVPVFPANAEELMGDPGLERELRDQVAEYLRSTAEALETTHGVEVSYAVLEGSPAQALAEHARAKRVGLIVMTTHGRPSR